MPEPYQPIVSTYMNAQGFRSLTDCVNHYMGRSSPDLTKQGMINELEVVKKVFEDPKSTEEEKATTLLVPDVIVNGKHQRIHQWRLKSDAQAEGLSQAIDILKAKLVNRDFDRFANFEDLYAEVCRSIGGVPGIGPLTVYDVAKRLWYAFGHALQNTDKVRILSGARTGLEALIGRVAVQTLLKKCLWGDAVYISNRPNKLLNLDALYIEDFLCVMQPILQG